MPHGPAFKTTVFSTVGSAFKATVNAAFICPIDATFEFPNKPAVYATLAATERTTERAALYMSNYSADGSTLVSA